MRLSSTTGILAAFVVLAWTSSLATFGQFEILLEEPALPANEAQTPDELDSVENLPVEMPELGDELPHPTAPAIPQLDPAPAAETDSPFDLPAAAETEHNPFESPEVTVDAPRQPGHTTLFDEPGPPKEKARLPEPLVLPPSFSEALPDLPEPAAEFEEVTEPVDNAPLSGLEQERLARQEQERLAQQLIFERAAARARERQARLESKRWYAVGPRRAAYPAPATTPSLSNDISRNPRAARESGGEKVESRQNARRWVARP